MSSKSKSTLPLTLALLIAPATAAAQIPYSVTHGTESYTPFAGGTVHPVVAYGAFPALDEGYATIPLPFSFDFYGDDYTTVYVFTNGFVGFAPPMTQGILGPPRNVPSPANPIHAFIGVTWGDLVGGTDPAVRSRVTGAAPDRVFEIQFEDFERNRSPAGTTGANFQVRLYEGTNTIDVVYGPNFGLFSNTAALENADGTEGLNLFEASPTCTGNCPCAVGQCASINFGGAGGKRIRVELPNQPEVQGVLRAPPGAFANSMFDVGVTVRNAGLGDAGGFSYQLLLSPSNTSLAGATVLDTYSVPSLQATSAVTATHTVTVPPGTPVGEFYVALSVDIGGAVTEVDETNNVTYSGVFRTGPELQGEVSGPVETGPGEPFDVQLDLRSAGAPVPGPVQVMFYLSPDPTLGMSAIQVQPELVTLPDGFATSQTLTLTAPVALPPSPPAYYVIADIDPQDAVTETDETNNLAVSMDTLTVRGPDIEVETLVTGDFGFLGLPFGVETRIANTGAVTARAFTVCIFLSDNLLINVISDLRLTETAPIDLAPGETQTLRLQPPIPTDTSTGAWYVATVADCGTAVPEPVETDNTRRRPDPITVMAPSPDLSPLEVRTASSGAAGETLPVTARVANLGNATGQAGLRLVISENPGVTASDLVIYEAPAPISLAAAEETTVSVWADLPSTLPTGNYYVGAIVDPDGAVDEILEDNNARAVGPIVVAGTDLGIVSPPPPNPVIGNPYAWRFAAAGGPSAYTWTLTWENGAPPDGLSFDPATAELSGEPTEAAEGSHPVTVRVQSGSLIAERTYPLVVAFPSLPLTVVTSRLPPAVAGETYSVQLVAAGGVPPYTWSLGSPGPAGVGIGETGELGGEPQLVGPSTFTVVVRDQAGQRATGRLSIDVVDLTASITITTADVPTGVVGEAYQTAFNVAGGTAPYSWTFGGAVPGLSFTEMGAQLTGTPTVAGEYEIEVEVRDDTGLVDRNAYLLEIYEEGALRILTGSEAADRLPPGTLNEPYLDADGEPARLRADPPEGTRWMLVNGVLPPGLDLDADSGEITGTPTEAGAFAFTVMVTNEANDVRRASLVIVIDDGSGPTGPADPGGCRNTRPQDGLLFGLLALGLLGVRRRR